MSITEPVISQTSPTCNLRHNEQIVNGALILESIGVIYGAYWVFLVA